MLAGSLREDREFIMHAYYFVRIFSLTVFFCFHQTHDLQGEGDVVNVGSVAQDVGDI
jgi:hypothetical protein